MLKNNEHFCRINLSKNNIGDQGLKEIGKILIKNRNIVHLDVSSNVF